ncbi:hypothetical protein GCM10023169_10770 [Georgenia halophila]|uniref:DUF4229 domain-containing protein n=1 Tax=Georgenia halophila TaxID=620889 RepID=A0ABP8L092_9MICO
MYDRFLRRSIRGTLGLSAIAIAAFVLLFVFDRLSSEGLFVSIAVVVGVALVILFTAFRQASERARRRAETASTLDRTASTDPQISEAGYDPMRKFRSPNE